MNILGIYHQQIEFSKFNQIKRRADRTFNKGKTSELNKSILYHNHQTQNYKKNSDVAIRMYSFQ
jgi:hypothetical protein